MSEAKRSNPTQGSVAVAVETPRHTSVSGLLDYASGQPLAPGTLVRVPLGRREVTGLVWERTADAGPPPALLRPIAIALTALPPLCAEWRALVEFAAAYYQRGVGELALAVLPPELRKLDDTQLARRMKRLAAAAETGATATPALPALPALPSLPTLSEEQAAALAVLGTAEGRAKPVLLHGVTGSGKTEVYLRAAADALARGQ